MKTVLEDFIILLVWISCIYKENLSSIILFIALAFFTFSRSGLAVTLIRYIVLVLFVTQYFSALSCVSSYNSPNPLPESILVNNTYPNDENIYFFVPIFFGYQEIFNKTVTSPSMIPPANIQAE